LPALQAPIQESHDHNNGAKAPPKAYTGSKKSCHRNQTRDFGVGQTVEFDRVLSQQSISGKIVSFIYVTRFWKISPNVTFYNSNIYHQNEEWQLPINSTVIEICSL